MKRGVSTAITYTVWSTDGSLLTGDAPEHTARISKDGGEYTVASGSPSEVGNGVYKITLTAGETDCSLLTLSVTSATVNAVIPPVQITFDTTESTVNSIPTSFPSVPSASSIADAVCDEYLSGHTTSGTLGAAFSATASSIATLRSDVTALATEIGELPTVEGIWSAEARTLTQSPDDVLHALASVSALLGAWSVIDDTLTTYETNGDVRATYTLNRDATGNIISCRQNGDNTE